MSDQPGRVRSATRTCGLCSRKMSWLEWNWPLWSRNGRWAHRSCVKERASRCPHCRGRYVSLHHPIDCPYRDETTPASTSVSGDPS